MPELRRPVEGAARVRLSRRLAVADGRGGRTRPYRTCARSARLATPVRQRARTVGDRTVAARRRYAVAADEAGRTVARIASRGPGTLRAKPFPRRRRADGRAVRVPARAPAGFR